MTIGKALSLIIFLFVIGFIIYQKAGLHKTVDALVSPPRGVIAYQINSNIFKVPVSYHYTDFETFRKWPEANLRPQILTGGFSLDFFSPELLSFEEASSKGLSSIKHRVHVNLSSGDNLYPQEKIIENFRSQRKEEKSSILGLVQFRDLKPNSTGKIGPKTYFFQKKLADLKFKMDCEKNARCEIWVIYKSIPDITVHYSFDDEFRGRWKEFHNSIEQKLLSFKIQQ